MIDPILHEHKFAGEKFSANQQCELVFGPESKVCSYMVLKCVDNITLYEKKSFLLVFRSQLAVVCGAAVTLKVVVRNTCLGPTEPNVRQIIGVNAASVSIGIVPHCKKSMAAGVCGHSIVRAVERVAVAFNLPRVNVILRRRQTVANIVLATAFDTSRVICRIAIRIRWISERSNAPN